MGHRSDLSIGELLILSPLVVMIVSLRAAFAVR
jgi:hypothetical protein